MKELIMLCKALMYDNNFYYAHFEYDNPRFIRSVEPSGHALLEKRYDDLQIALYA